MKIGKPGTSERLHARSQLFPCPEPEMVMIIVIDLLAIECVTLIILFNLHEILENGYYHYFILKEPTRPKLHRLSKARRIKTL